MKKKHCLVMFSACVLAVGMALLISRLLNDVQAQSGGATRRISVDSYGQEANGGSGDAAISANGRFVAFESWATNLVSGDNNDKSDIFVYDRAMRSLTRVSLTDDDTEANENSYNPVLSADGRFVAFDSYADNLVAGDTNNWVDVFARDRQTGSTVRVSVASDGSQGQYGGSGEPAISADGRFVAFDSCATNLVISDTNDYCDIFVHDRDADGDNVFDEPGEVNTVRVSIASDGTEANGHSYYPSLSAGGRFVAFESNADNLVANDANGFSDIFLHDRDPDEDGIFDEPGEVSTILVSVASGGAQGNNNSWSAAISADGRYVTFASDATNLSPADNNAYRDIFLRDWKGGRTTRISVSSAGEEGDGHSEMPSISFDGRFVAFVSWAYDLDSTCNYAAKHVFVRDRLTGQTTCVSLASDGTQAYGNSTFPSISADGRFVAFDSVADNLVPDDTNNRQDIFLRDRVIGGPVAASIPAAGGMLAASGVIVDFPPGAFTSTVVVTHTARSAGDVPSPGNDLTGIGHFFDLDAVYEATDQPARLASGKTCTVTVWYSDEEKGAAIESTLAFYYWNGSQWVKEAGSQADTTGNTVTVAPDHLSLWAILGETRRVYLPLVLKNS